MKTFMANPAKIDRKWYVVDAEGKTLGRLASEVAKVLRGKNKPEYTRHVDTGDYVIVVNAEKDPCNRQEAGSEDLLSSFRLCWRYEGCNSEREKLNKKPEQVIELAVKGMLVRHGGVERVAHLRASLSLSRRRLAKDLLASALRPRRPCAGKEILVVPAARDRVSMNIHRWCGLSAASVSHGCRASL